MANVDDHVQRDFAATLLNVGAYTESCMALLEYDNFWNTYSTR